MDLNDRANNSPVYKSLRQSANTIMKLADSQEKQIETAIELLIEAYSMGHKVLTCGNGGSASQAQHMATELVGRFKKERRALPAIALTADSSIITALGNDYGFEYIFSRQVEAYGNEGDVLIAFSTSGRSVNIIQALLAAKSQGMKTVAIVGQHTKELADCTDVLVSVPSDNTPLIQDAHGVICHVICERLESIVK